MLAAPSAWPSNIDELAKQSDAVVVGSVAERLETGDSVSFNMSLERVVQGQNVPAVVQVTHPWTIKGLHGAGSSNHISAQVRGLWFLKRLGTYGWDVLVPNGQDGMFISLFWHAAQVLPKEFQYLPGTATVDAVAFEVAAGMSVNTGMSVNARSQIPFAIGALKTPTAQAVLLKLLDSPDQPVKSATLAALMMSGYSGSLSVLSRLWPAINMDPSRQYVIDALSTWFRDQRPESVRQLVAIANTNQGSPDLRGAIIEALTSMHTGEALPFLASLLQSQDFSERMRGVTGLAWFANGCPARTPDNTASLAYLIPSGAAAPYQTEATLAHMGLQGPRTTESMAELVTFWESWWSNHLELH
jgi:hypothetical protein